MFSPNKKQGRRCSSWDAAPDERITGDVGREICQRVGIKAMLNGSIANLGSQYVITLDAVNASTGESLAREEMQASNKESVLNSLHERGFQLAQEAGRVAGLGAEVRQAAIGSDYFIAGSAQSVQPWRHEAPDVR